MSVDAKTQDLLSLCDEIIANFYLAASSGLVSNKAACVDFAYRFLNETVNRYQIIPKNKSALDSLNQSLSVLDSNTECVENAFGAMFALIQAYRGDIKAWLDVSGRS